MTQPEPAPKTREQYAAERLERQMREIATRLRDVADNVEREIGMIAQVGTNQVPSYAAVAQDVQHATLYSVGNLRLGGLTASAYDADAARIKGE